jgi:hypothetical protein
MNPGRTFLGKQGAFRRAMSMIEMMVAVTLLVVIILGLTAMFNQTRKAFNVGLSNVDYQDAGRAALDFISRDLQQMSPGSYGNAINTGFGLHFDNSLNFYASLPPALDSIVYWPMTAGDATNFNLETMFFVTASNRLRTAVGYRLVLADSTNFHQGTLYRYSAIVPNQANLLGGPATCFQLNNFFFDPANNLNTNMNRVIDGVVDFRIRAYDRNGVLIPTLTNGIVVATKPPPPAAEIFTTNYTGNASLVSFGPTASYWVDPNVGATNTNIFSSAQTAGDYNYAFYSNAVPAYVDIELGIMETPALQQLQALTNPVSSVAYFNFLTNHAAQVHIFRQRVTIPSADPAAYP